MWVIYEDKQGYLQAHKVQSIEIGNGIMYIATEPSALCHRLLLREYPMIKVCTDENAVVQIINARLNGRMANRKG